MPLKNKGPNPFDLSPPHLRIDETLRKLAVSAPTEALSALARVLKPLNDGGGPSALPSDSGYAMSSMASKLGATFFLRALWVKRKLHVAITGGQAVGVMVTPKHHHRRNLIRIACHSDVEMASVRDVIGRLRNDRSGCPGSVLLVQVRREEQLSHGNALIRVASWKQTGIRGHHRKRRVIGSDERFPVFPREEHRGIRQQRRGPM